MDCLLKRRGGVQPHFCPWKNVCFPIFPHGKKWENTHFFKGKNGVGPPPPQRKSNKKPRQFYTNKAKCTTNCIPLITGLDANKVQEHNKDPNILKGHTHCAFENKDNCYRICQDVNN